MEIGLSLSLYHKAPHQTMLLTFISAILGFMGKHVSHASLHVAGRQGDGRSRLTYTDADSSASLTSSQSTHSLSELDTVYPSPPPSAAQSFRDFFSDRGTLLLLILFLFGVELFFIFWFYGSSILRHVIPRSRKFKAKKNVVEFTSFKNGDTPRRPETKQVRFHNSVRVKEFSERATRRLPARPAALVLKPSPVLKHSSPLREPPQQSDERENVWMF